MPNYFVNDGTKIDIIVVEDDMRSSMVRNNFEKSSVDAKTGGGYAGLGIGMTAGLSREIQMGEKKEKKTFATKMIGQYMVRGRRSKEEWFGCLGRNPLMTRLRSCLASRSYSTRTT